MLNRATYTKNLQTCLTCAGGVKTPGEIVRCPVAADPVAGHAREGNCPKGLLVQINLPTKLEGAAGVARALIGIDRASEELIRQREAICTGCDKAVMVAGLFRKCSICGCATHLKIMNAGEKCPIGKW